MKLSLVPQLSGQSKGQPRRCKPNWLVTYQKYTEATESPTKFHLWSGIAAIAGALRRKVWFRMGFFEWTPNFFIFLVAPPGIVSKSTTAGLAMDLLSAVDGVTFGPSSVTWQALIERFQEVHICWPLPGNDILGPGLDMSCLTIAASELGTFFNPDDREMIDVLVDLWDGRKGRFVRQTIGRGTKVAINPWLNLIACTTPRWIAEHLSNHFTGGGFSSRSIFVYADAKRQLVAYPFLETRPDHDELRDDLLHDLKRIATLYGEFTATEKALELGKHLYNETYLRPPVALASDFYLGYMARKQTHTHKLAMVLSAAESDSLVIEERHIAAADAFLREVELDMSNVFRIKSKIEPVADIQMGLAATLLKLKKVRRSDFYMLFFKEVTLSTFSEALDGLITSGMAILRQMGTETWIEANEDRMKELNVPMVKEEK